jgi:hypothetical protein
VVEHFNGQFEIVRWVGPGPLTGERELAAVALSSAA